QLREMGHSPAALRYALLAGHPRKQLNFTLDSLHAAEKALTTLRNFREQLVKRGLKPDHAPSTHFDGVIASLNHELNTPAALGQVFSFINQFNANPAHPLHLGDLAAFDRVIFALGLDLTKPEAPQIAIPPGITALAEQRWAAKQAKDWATADRLRADLAATGWLMKDRKDGYDLEPAC
ncbi:MAG: cysteine--tRNA ligase, partial [Verrucomicrobiota bacterium]